MVACNNCQKSFEPDDDTLVASTGLRLVAAICGECVRDVAIASVTLRRDADGCFQYMQLIPVAMKKTFSGGG